MVDIKINKVGKIIQGDDQGNYIKIFEDPDTIGAFFILISRDQNMTNCFDDWVKDMDALQSYYVESNWIIEWVS